MKEATLKKNIADAISKRVSEKRPLPKVGQGASYGIGSDHYGYQVMSVAKDLSWFTYGCTNYAGELQTHGFAKLCTKKNSRAFGNYIRCYYAPSTNCAADSADYWTNPDKWEPEKPWCSCGSRYYNIIGLTGTDGEVPTYLDPSF